MAPTPALVLLAGEPPSVTLLREEVREASLIFAADGAAEYARSAGIAVHRIVGDLDSITATSKKYFLDLHTEIEHDPDQYSDDFEKTLKSLRESYDGAVRVLGLSGKRMDHTLTNLSVLRRATLWFEDIRAIDDHLEHFFLVEGRSKFESADMALDSIVSLTPFGSAYGVRTEGLLYPITDEDMHVGEREGLSNRVTGSPVIVTLRSGALLVSIDRPRS